MIGLFACDEKLMVVGCSSKSTDLAEGERAKKKRVMFMCRILDPPGSF